MNERIKKLYEQSFVTDDYVNVGINGVELGIRFDPEKFALLIVRECADCVDFYTSDGNGPASDVILNHFGVKE